MTITSELNNDLTLLKERVSGHINEAIKVHSLKGLLDANQISDGYHTFGELYECRNVLWVKLCEMMFDIDDTRGEVNQTWKSKENADGATWDGWFLLGYGHDTGKQITFHLPMALWDMCYFAEEIDSHPYDGHTTPNVLKRLREL